MAYRLTGNELPMGQHGDRVNIAVGPSKTWTGNYLHFGNEEVDEDERWISGVPQPSKNGVKDVATRKRKRNPASNKKGSRKRAVITSKKPTSAQCSLKTPSRG
jgi:hypothetical protein